MNDNPIEPGQPPALRYDQRPADHTPIHTEALPPTPIRDRNIVATAWIEAPEQLLTLGRRSAEPTGGRVQAADRRLAAVAGGSGRGRRRPLLGGPRRRSHRSNTRFGCSQTTPATALGPAGSGTRSSDPWKEDLLGR